jgi:hypothetical protein
VVCFVSMKRLLWVLAPLALVGLGCNPPSADELAARVKEQVQNTVTQAVEKGAEEVAKQRTGGDVDLDITHGGASYTDPATGRYVAVGEHVAIPDQFPDDIPVYENGTPTSVSIEGSGKSASLLVLTKDGRNTIRDWFLSAAESKGWAREGVVETADNIVISFARPDDASAKLSVTIMPPNLQKEVSVLVLRKGE